MHKLLLAFVVMSSCAATVKMKTDDNMGERPPWFFRADYPGKGDNKMTYSWNCFKTKSLCQGALDVSKKYGGLADVKALTICKET